MLNRLRTLVFGVIALALVVALVQTQGIPNRNASAADGCTDLDGNDRVDALDAIIVSDYFLFDANQAPQAVNVVKDSIINIIDVATVFGAYDTSTDCQGDPQPVTSLAGGEVAVDAIGEITDQLDPVNAKRTVQLGESFLVSIHITDNPADLSGAQICLSWDEAILDIDLRTAAINNAWPASVFGQALNPADDDSGNQACLTWGSIFLPPASDDNQGPIAQFSFSCEAPGSADIFLRDSDLTLLLARPATAYVPDRVGTTINCIDGDSPTATPFPTPTPEDTATTLLTATPFPTPTPEDTATPGPTATPSPIKTELTFDEPQFAPGDVLQSLPSHNVDIPNGFAVLNCAGPLDRCRGPANSGFRAASSWRPDMSAPPFVVKFATGQSQVSVFVKNEISNSREYFIGIAGWDGLSLIDTETITLPPGNNEWHQVSVQSLAGDISEVEVLGGASGGAWTNLILVDSLSWESEPPLPTTNEVSPWRIEIHQFNTLVQDLCPFRSDTLSEAFAADTPAEALDAIPLIHTETDCFPPLVPGKDAVVRLYLLAEQSPYDEYRHPMRLRVEYRNGTVTPYTIFQNVILAGFEDGASVPLDPGTFNERQILLNWIMRLDPTLRANYVIPGGFLEDAVAVEIEWNGLAHPPLRLDVLEPARIGLHLVRVGIANEAPAGSFGFGGTCFSDSPAVIEPPTFEEIEASIIPYLEQRYPVSEVRVLSRREEDCADIGTIRYDTFIGPIWEAPPYDCGFALGRLKGAYAAPGIWDEIAGRSWTDDPHYTIVGVYVGNDVIDAAGCAPYGSPASGFQRFGRVLIAETVSGFVAAHEIGHIFNFKHASNAHGEGRDGQQWSSWPIPHGMLAVGDFRTVTRFDATRGAWNVTWLDPCPIPSIVLRVPSCALLDDIPAGTNPRGPWAVHELMSYGPNRDVSLHRKGKMQDALYSDYDFGIFSAAGGAAGGDLSETTEALLINVAVAEDGTSILFPISRRRLPAGLTALVQEGDHTLELWDAEGNLLLERTVELSDVGEWDHDEIEAFVPYFPNLARIVVREGQNIIFDEVASPNAPQVEMISPNGGEVLLSGTHEIMFNASDLDGDALDFIVEYSPDGGTTWEPIYLGGGGPPYELPVDVSILTPSDHGLFRVSASDGINTAADESDCPIAIGSNQAATCQGTQPDATPTAVGSAPCDVRGDVNGNGVVDVIDAALILQLTAALVDDLPCIQMADADGNGSVNVIDAALVLQLSAGLIDSLPR